MNALPPNRPSIRLRLVASLLVFLGTAWQAGTVRAQAPAPAPPDPRLAQEYAAAQGALNQWLAALKSVECTFYYTRKTHLPPMGIEGLETKTEWLWSDKGCWQERFSEMSNGRHRLRMVRGSTREQSFEATYQQGMQSNVGIGSPSMARSGIQKGMWGYWSNAQGDWLPRFLCEPHATPEGFQAVGGHECLVVRVELSGGSPHANQPLAARLYLDSRHGYLPLRADYLAPDQSFQNSVLEFAKLEVAGQPLWMPLRGETTIGPAAQPEPWEWFELKLNHPVSVEQIRLPPPAMALAVGNYPPIPADDLGPEFNLVAAAPVVALYASAIAMLGGTFWYVRWDSSRRARAASPLSRWDR